MKKSKQGKLLPNRSALKELGKGQKTIADYAKATPLAIGADSPSLIQNLRKVK